MVSPHRRREAVCVLQRRLGISERRACEITGQHRSTQRYEPKPAADDQALRRALRRVSRDHKRWGYRRAHGYLVNEKGWCVNRKRVQRVWREAGLRVPAKPKKRRRAGASSAETPEKAEHPGHIWALDFQHDATEAGTELRFLNVIDEFTARRSRSGSRAPLPLMRPPSCSRRSPHATGSPGSSASTTAPS